MESLQTLFNSDTIEVGMFCQCCLSNTQLRNMLNQYEFGINVENYLDMLEYSFSIQIRQFHNEIFICHGCIEKLRAACSFRELVAKTQESIADKLLNKVKTHNDLIDGKNLTAKSDESSLDVKGNSDECVKVVYPQCQAVLGPVGFVNNNSNDIMFVPHNNDDHDALEVDIQFSNSCVEDNMCENQVTNCSEINKQTKLPIYIKSSRKPRKINDKPRRNRLPYKLDRNNLQCEKCMQLFVCFKDLQNHMHNHYPNHVCDICGKFFATGESLKNHLRRQHSAPRFKCPECSKMYKQHNALLNHITTIHRGEKLVYKCTECSDQFNTFHKRVTHMIHQHGLANRLTYKCQECPRVFIHCSELRAHVRRDHRLERRHKCDKCDSAFFLKKMLNEHLLSHSGVRNFQCEICSKAFGRKETLRGHLKTHEISKSCFVCGQTFSLLSSLRRHEKSHDVGDEIF